MTEIVLSDGRLGRCLTTRTNGCFDACVGIPDDELDWVSVKDRLPINPGKYLIFAESADPNCPLINQALFSMESGFSGIPAIWCDSITHWRGFPRNDPNSQRDFFDKF
jgi:hypothetical protein